MSSLQKPLDGSPQDAVTAPPLGREAARAVIARRLRALDHRPDLLDNQAIAALVEHAGGSGVRLRAALAATLFLASTEDAPRIGRTLVQRALLESGDIPAAPVAAAPRPWRRLLVPGAALACAGLVAILLMLRPSGRSGAGQPAAAPDQAAPVQVDRAPAPPAATDRSPAGPQIAAPQPAPPPTKATAPVVPAPAALPTPAAPAPTVPLPPAETAPAKTAAAVPAPPAASPAEPPAPLPPDLPAAPSASVVLMVSGRDPETAQRLDGLIKHLRDAGISQIVTEESPPARARRPVSYFFADDLPLAMKMTQLLAREEWPRLARNSLSPRLVIPPSGIAPRQPGLIEIQLP